MEKSGLILEGGGLRGLFTGGAVDCLIDNQIEFQYVAGVSAGGGNALNYVAKQKYRMKKIMMPEDKRLNGFGFHAFLRCGKLIDLKHMYFDYPYKYCPFDYEAYFNSDKECEFVATNCITGEAEYLSESKDEYRLSMIGMATCTVPLVCKPTVIDGIPYLDGSISDSLPIKRAIEKGCKRQFVIFTREEETKPTDYKKMMKIIKIVFKKYPKLINRFHNRFDEYYKELNYLKELEKEGKIYILRPEIPSISKTKPDYERAEEFYIHGYELMNKKLPELKEFLKS